MELDLYLDEPNLKYESSFRNIVRQYELSGEKLYYDMYKDALDEFGNYVQMLINHSKGIYLPTGWVPYYTFWLTDNTENIYGVIRIRTLLNSSYLKEIAGHIGYDIPPLFRRIGYGKKILELGLEKAKFLGLDKILLTCSFDNYASIKVIEGNGGLFESEIFNTGTQKLQKRYWIYV